MQTVTPIIASAAPAGAGPSGDSGDKAAFPTTLRGAMAPQDGKTSPPADGKTLPDGAQPTEPAQAPATSTAGSLPAGDGDDASTMPLMAAQAPAISTALHDIAASRKAARAGDPPLASAAAAEPVTATGPMEPSGPLADASPAADTEHDTPAAPSAAESVATPPAAPLAAPTLPPAAPSGNSNGNSIAAAATQHAREVVLDRPAASRAFGLFGKVSSTDATTPDTDTPSTNLAPAAAPTSITTAGSDAPQQAATAPASSAPLIAATPPSQPMPDFTALGAPALAAASGHAAPPPPTAGIDAPASALPDFHIVASPGSPQFGLELGERVLWLVRDGLHEARLQLNPRDLGPVEVRLSIGDGAAQVSFSAQHAGTAAAVQQSLPQLRDLLAQQGLQLGQATVSHQPAGDGQAAQQQAQGSGGQPGWERSRGADMDDGLPLQTARVVGQGLVDAYA